MPVEKITITTKLRLDIIERRKKLGISSYELSEKTGNGHSKFWLQNIESGKTKKITKDDLIKIYMILSGDDTPNNAIVLIEQLLNQNIGGKARSWYELIDISQKFSETYDEDELMETLDDLLDNKFIPKIRDVVFGMSVNQKQAALTALQNLYYSLYIHSDLVFALMGIPLYGVKDLNESENITAMNDILKLYSKFSELATKNKGLERVREQQKYDDNFYRFAKKWINIALDNFQKIISELYEIIHEDNPNLRDIMLDFNTNVSFLIERGQPNALKNYLKTWDIVSGEDFATHIKECIFWFIGFGSQYELPFVYDVVDEKQLKEICEFLNNHGSINPIYRNTTKSSDS